MRKLGVITILVAILINSIGSFVIAKDNKLEFSLTKEGKKADSKTEFKPVQPVCFYGEPNEWMPAVPNQQPPQGWPFFNPAAPPPPYFGEYGKDPYKAWENPNGDAYNPGGPANDKNGAWEWSDKGNTKDPQIVDKKDSEKDSIKKEDKVNQKSFDNEPRLLSKDDESHELTLINAELEKARIELALIKEKAQEKISMNIKEVKEKIMAISNDKSLEAFDKSVKINKLKEELSAKIKDIKEEAAQRVKDVIDKQNSNIESILSYS